MTVLAAARHRPVRSALAASSAHVEVSWSVENIKNEATFQFDWREIDGPAVVKPERRGFGSRLIEEILARDFDVASAIEYLSLGVHCRITSPLRSLKSD